MSEQSRDQWAMELLTDTLALEWYSSDPQARKVADAAAVEVERLQAAKTKAEEAELAAAGELDEVKAERDVLARDLEAERYHRQAIERSEQALAAHVDRLTSRSNAVFAANNVSAIAGMTQLLEAVDEAPTTSLARLKAEWQAEALHNLLMHPRESTLRKKACTMRDELRRQAKEATE